MRICIVVDGWFKATLGCPLWMANVWDGAVEIVTDPIGMDETVNNMGTRLIF